MLVSVSSFADSVSGKDSGADVFSSFFTSTDSDVSFARHGRALAGESPEHAQVVGRITPDLKKHGFRWIRKQPVYFRKVQKEKKDKPLNDRKNHKTSL